MENYKYVNTHTKEEVYDCDVKSYVLEKLGIQITPAGKNGEMTTDQIEFIENTIEWFFSGNWIKEEIKEEN